MRDFFPKAGESGSGATPRLARGFALLSRERMREISSAGGKRAHELGVAHQFTSEEARTAGHKGGLASKANRGPRKCGRCDKPGHLRPTCRQVAP